MDKKENTQQEQTANTQPQADSTIVSGQNSQNTLEISQESNEVEITNDGNMVSHDQITNPDQSAETPKPDIAEIAGVKKSNEKVALVAHDPSDPGIVPSLQPAMPTGSTTTEFHALERYNKRLKAILVVLILLFVCGASFGAWYYYESTQKEAKTLEASVLSEKLEQEKNASSDLKVQLEAKETQLQQYSETILQLKDICGNICSAVSTPGDDTKPVE